MLLKYILLSLCSGALFVYCQANCLTGSVQCHQAATCKNVSGIPTCVCDPWYIGDGIDDCYGFCNASCGDVNSFCRSNTFGSTCLCVSPSPNCPTAPAPPSNVQASWRSSDALTFTWDFVLNAHSYHAVLSNATWSSGNYFTIVTVAGFKNLRANSVYTFTVKGLETGKNADNSSRPAIFNATTAAAKARNADICDQPQGCRANTDECSLGTHLCHPEATCANTNNGYTCSCNDGFVGNGTHCIGSCITSCNNGQCVPTQFGSTCVCPSRSSRCKVPETPTNLRVVLQTTESLAFKWQHSVNVISYKATLLSTQHPGFRKTDYRTEVPQAAFTGLLPNTTYTVSVEAFNRKGVSAGSPVSTTSTVIASGPAVKVTNKSATSISISYSPVPHALFYYVEYYTDPDLVFLETTEATKLLLDNLTPKKEYSIIVYAIYEAGTSNGSDILKVVLEEYCNNGDQICHRNATCSSRRNRCICQNGFSGNGVQCNEIFGIPFRVKVMSGETEENARNSLVRSLSNSSDVIDTSVSPKENGFIRFVVYTLNMNFLLNSIDRNIFAEDVEPLKDVCLPAKLLGFTFNESRAGMTQRSSESCSNGAPIANISCVATTTHTEGAFLLRSLFTNSSLSVAVCPFTNHTDVIIDLPGVAVEIPVEAIQKALAQLNITDVTPTVEVELEDDVIDQRFPSDFDVSAVITVDIGENTTIENLPRPIRITNVFENTSYGQTEALNQFVNTRVVQQCVFWDEETQSWSGEGCCLNNYLHPPTCECNHLTSFAILVSTKDVPGDLALTVISDIGCALSILGLAATFFILILNKEARVKIPNIIQMHFTFTLFLTYMIFLFGVSRVENYALCTAITALLQYVFLVSWVWIAIYSNRLYVALANVFKQTGTNFIKKCCVFAYGVPLLIVAFNVGITVGYFDKNHRNEELCNPDDPITKKSYYRAENMCWLESYSLYFGFLIIVGIVLLNNIVVLVLVSNKLFQKQNIRSTRAKRSKFSDLISAISLSFTLGVTWLFGFFMLLSDNITYNVVMSWLFAIFTASQGFAIWYVTCVRRKDIRDFWWGPLKQKFILIAIKLCCYVPQMKESKLKERSSTVTSIVTTTA